MPVDARNRPDLHNVEVDEEIAGAGACGYEVLRTGCVCPLPPRHPGPCAFVPRPQARAAVLLGR